MRINIQYVKELIISCLNCKSEQKWANFDDFLMVVDGCLLVVNSGLLVVNSGLLVVNGCLLVVNGGFFTNYFFMNCSFFKVFERHRVFRGLFYWMPAHNFIGPNSITSTNMLCCFGEKKLSFAKLTPTVS